MNPTRSLILSAFVIALSFSSVAAQVRQRIPPPRDPQFYEPRNKLEEFETRLETVLIKGRTWVGTLRANDGAARVEALEIRDAGNSTRAIGVLITIVPADQNRPTSEIRSLVDYEEIDPLVKAFDFAARADDKVTRLVNFEVRYRTKGDFEIVVFKQTTGGLAAAIEAGFIDRTRLLLTLDELTKLRWMIAQAKEKLDELK